MSNVIDDYQINELSDTWLKIEREVGKKIKK